MNSYSEHFILLFLFISTYTFAQEDSVNLFEKNHFSLQLSNGISTSSYEPNLGEETPLESYGLVSQLLCDYQFNILPGMAVSINSGFVLHPMNIRIASKDPYTGNLKENYFLSAQYIFYGRAGVALRYNHQLGKGNWLLHSTLGGGISFIPPWEIQFENNASSLNNFNYNFTAEQLVNPFISASIGIERKLKNLDLMGWSFYGQFYPKPIIRGSYNLYNNSASGSIVNSGSNFGINLSYTFTQGRKILRIKNFKTKNINEKKAKEKFKKESRFVHDKSKFFSLGTGMFFPQNEVFDENHFYTNSFAHSFTIFGKAAFGLVHGFYLEAGVSFERYKDVFKHELGSNAGPEFWAGKLSFGLNKRIINPATNFNFLNVFGGISFGIHNDEVNEIKENNLGFSVSNGTYFFSTVQSTNTNKTIGSLYIGLEKDFKIGDHFYLNLGYKYDEGLFTVRESHIIYETNNFSPKEAKSRMNGTAHTIFFGFKYKLSPTNNDK